MYTQVINLTNKKLISSCSLAVNEGNSDTNSVEGKGGLYGEYRIIKQGKRKNSLWAIFLIYLFSSTPRVTPSPKSEIVYKGVGSWKSQDKNIKLAGRRTYLSEISVALIAIDFLLYHSHT